MKVLLVIAHPNPKSFNHAVLDAFKKGLDEAGHTCDVVDLYKMNFAPCLCLEDFASFQGGQLPQDVLAEQERVSQSDAIAIFYPVWWWDYPAILKGWFERVFSMGFAFKFGEKGLEGLLNHKKALLVCTTAGPEQFYQESGIEDAMRKISESHCLKESGIQDVQHVFLYGVTGADDVRKTYLEKVHTLGKEF